MFRVILPDKAITESIKDLEGLDAKSAKLLSMALNKAIFFGRAAAAREMKTQVAFPARYLTNTRNGRLSVNKQASAKSLEASIVGRTRPTSLARFVRGVPKRGPVAVTVKPGRPVTMKRAFVVNNLRVGDDGGRGNIGLAIRTDGSKPTNAYKPTKLSENVYLLYGPSVDQVFQTVRFDIEDSVVNKAKAEFERLLNVRGKF